MLCAAICAALCLASASCGSKKAKMHIQKNIESSLAKISSVDDSQQATNADGEPETTRKEGDVTVMTMHTYEFFDYSGEKGKYNSSSKDFLEKYHFAYTKSNISAFNSAKNYIIKKYSADDEPEFQCKLQKDGSAKYVDKNGKEITDSTIIGFFKKNEYIKSIRYFDRGGDDYLYFDYFVPSFLGDLDYLLIMSAVYCPSVTKTRMSGEDVESVQEIGGGWYYQIQHNNAVKIQVVN